MQGCVAWGTQVMLRCGGWLQAGCCRHTYCTGTGAQGLSFAAHVYVGSPCMQGFARAVIHTRQNRAHLHTVLHGLALRIGTH